MNKVERNVYFCLKPTAVCLAVLSVFSTQVLAEVFTEDKITEGKRYSVTDSQSYESFNVTVYPEIKWDEYLVSASEGGSFKIDGTTFFRSFSSTAENVNDYGTYSFYAFGYGKTQEGNDDPTKSSKIILQGDIDAYVLHDMVDRPPEEEYHYVGANLFYAENGGEITLGGEDTTTKAWVIAEVPDLISAKHGGKVNVQSVRNQFVGSIDLIDPDGPAQINPDGTNKIAPSSVTAKFVGKDSFWYGDEQSFMNFGVNTMPIKDLLEKYNLLEDLGALLSEEITVPEIAAVVKEALQGKSENERKALFAASALFEKAYYYQNDNLSLAFKDGAEWSYFGQEKEGGMSGVNGKNIVKRISSITLDGGVINLADEYLDMRWKEIGLAGVLDIQDDFKHDYVRIGDLKGSGGIFRIDLNGEEKSQSDMIFIESTSETAAVTHKIEPYKLDTLSIIANSDEKLIFALAQAGANNIKFEDKANYYGETLFDYEVEIASEKINADVLDEFDKGGYVKYDSFDADDYNDGTAWFIQHVNLKQSTASIGMRGAGYASYDAAVQMDRHDRRIKESVFADGRDSGLWVRVQHGQMGAKGVYSSDVDTVYLGAEGKLTDRWRLGASFSYLDGDADFSDIKGSNDMERYEGSVYGTFESGAHYLDVVARFGRVNSDFYTSNAAVTKSGVFHHKYAALSAEYGYKFNTGMGFFVEPQVQGQATYLSSHDANVNGTMSMEADSTTSFIGRVGMRMGKTIRSEAVAAEVYARADALHQFTDGQDAVLRNKKGERIDVTWGDAGTWYNYGVGGYLNWKDRFGLQLDLEKSSGGEVDDTWLLSGRLNYYF